MKIKKNKDRPEKYDILRFLRFVDEKVGVGGCWNWKGSKQPYGYGNFRYKEKTELAHRVSYRLFVGEIPEGLFVCHHCDNPSCIRPSHLFIGTHLDNMRDRDKKGRGVTQGNKYNGLQPKGEKNGKSKLTEEKVREIRKRYYPGIGIQLSKEYGVDECAIYNAVKRITWKHVD